MSEPAPYGLSQARRSLAGFARWKLASALMGVALLLLLARLAPAAEYGVYVALLALVEMFYLLSGLGLSALPQRYLPEYRLHASAAQLHGLLRRLLWRRSLQSLAGLLLLGLLWWLAPGLLGVPLEAATAVCLALWLLAGCQTRMADEIFPALLLQSHTQGLQALGNLLRLTTLTAALWLGHGLDHRLLVAMEALLALLLAALGGWLLRRHLAGQALPAQTAFREPDTGPVVWQMYWAQLAAQLWSGNAIKLLLLRVAGPQATALYGFCQALVDLLRNYSPAFLLGNWVRPLMVARYVAGRDFGSVASLAGLVLKLSALGLLPFLAWFAVQGELLAAELSAGRYAQGAAALLAGLCAVAMLFCGRAVLSMVSITVEQMRVQMTATFVCALSLPLALLAYKGFGLVGVISTMAAAELVWCGWLVLAMRAKGFELVWSGAWRLVAISLVVLVLSALATQLPSDWSGPVRLLIGLSVSMTSTCFAIWLLNPLSTVEKADLFELLPARFRRAKVKV